MQKTDDFISRKLRDLKQSIAQKNTDVPITKSNFHASQYNSMLPVNVVEENEHKIRRISQEPNRNAPTIIEEETHTKIRTEYPPNSPLPTSLGLKYNNFAVDATPQPIRLTVPSAGNDYKSPLFASRVETKAGVASPINDHLGNTEPRVIRTQRVIGQDVNSMHKAEQRTVYQTADFNPSATVYVDRNASRQQSFANPTMHNSMSKTTILERYRTNMTGDLNARLQENMESNHRLSAEVSRLRSALQAEQAKTQDAERICMQDFAEVEMRERESHKTWEETQRELQGKEESIKRKEDASYKVSLEVKERVGRRAARQ